MTGKSDREWPAIEFVDVDDSEAFHEWLLSDHPWATAERQRRRDGYQARELAAADEVLAIASRLLANPNTPDKLLRTARIIARLADQRAARAEVEAAFDDDAYVANARRQLEIVRQVGGEHNYCYPRRLTGRMAHQQPPPGWTR